MRNPEEAYRVACRLKAFPQYLARETSIKVLIVQGLDTHRLCTIGSVRVAWISRE